MSPPTPAAAQDQAGGEGKPATREGQVVDLLFKAAVSAAGAVGFLGFVAFTGGAIFWMRFTAAELPADQAVTVIPRSELVTVGAVSLTGFVVAGVLAVLAVYLLDNLGRARQGNRLGLIALVTLELLGALVLTEDEAAATIIAAAALIVLAGAANAAIGFRFTHPRGGGATPPRRRESLVRDMISFDPNERRKLSLPGLIAQPVLAAVTAGGLVLLTGEWWLAVAVAAAALLAAAAFGVAAATGGRFLWYGVSVFASVALYGAVVTSLHVLESPVVQPAAVARAQGGAVAAVQGLYVTQTDERIYLASLTARCKGPDRVANQAVTGSGRLFSIPRDEVRAFLVGPLQRIPAAEVRARGLQVRLAKGDAGGVPARSAGVAAVHRDQLCRDPRRPASAP